MGGARNSSKRMMKQIKGVKKTIRGTRKTYNILRNNTIQDTKHIRQRAI